MRFARLRLFSIVSLLLVLVVTMPLMTGCSAVKQAATHQKIADSAAAAADRIESGLAAAPPGGVVDIEALKALIPIEWHATLDKMVASGTDAVTAAREISVNLREIEQENRRAQEDILTSIENGTDRWTQAQVQVQSAAYAINPAVGLALTVIGLGAGWWKTWQVAKQRGETKGLIEGAAESAEIVNAGRFASTEFNEMFQGEAGKAMKAQLAKSNPIVAATIQAQKLGT